MTEKSILRGGEKLRRIYILFFLFFVLTFTVLFSQNLIFYGGFRGRILPKDFLNNKGIDSCIFSLSKYLENQPRGDSIFVDLGNSLYGSAQSVYYLMNKPSEFFSEIINLKTTINCIGQEDLYIDQNLLKKLINNGLNFYSINIDSKSMNVRDYSSLDNGKIIFIPISFVNDKLRFENFEISDPFESLKKTLDSFNFKDNKPAHVIVGISIPENSTANISEILSNIDDRVDLIVVENKISGTIDMGKRKVFLLSAEDVLNIQMDGEEIKYRFDSLSDFSSGESKTEIKEVEDWLNYELCSFMYKPRYYGFNGLNPVNTPAEFLVNVLESHPNTIPIIVFKQSEDSQKITRKDVLKVVNHGVFFTTQIPGKDLKELFNGLIKERILFEVGNINYVAQIDKKDPVQWLEYKGYALPKGSLFRLVTNDPNLMDLNFRATTRGLQDILNANNISMKYIKNWYIIDEPFDEEFRYYVVDWGDSIGSLSLIFQKDAKLLMDINGLKDPRKLMTGDILIIPMF